jgi:16S rRNA (cytosine967-C5)-methyltransferase
MPKEGTDKYLSVKYSLPEWLISMWRESYGSEKTEKLLDGMNRAPYMTLRVNTLKNTREELINALAKDGIDCSPSDKCDSAVIFNSNVAIADLEALGEGLCFIQDEASQLCVKAVGAKAGETVIDTCSCPGGKSFGIALEMKNEGKLISLDLHESKLSLVVSGAERLGITILNAEVHNGTKPKEDLIGTADRVLCDVPCSGLGVIAKKPDLRHKSPDDISRLPEIQYKILCNGATYLRSGGTLVYSTCTLNKAENEEIAEPFLIEHPEFSPCGDGMYDGKPMMTFFPDVHGTDGFFVAKFIKK